MLMPWPVAQCAAMLMAAGRTAARLWYDVTTRAVVVGHIVFMDESGTGSANLAQTHLVFASVYFRPRENFAVLRDALYSLYGVLFYDRGWPEAAELKAKTLTSKYAPLSVARNKAWRDQSYRRLALRSALDRCFSELPLQCVATAVDLQAVQLAEPGLAGESLYRHYFAAHVVRLQRMEIRQSVVYDSREQAVHLINNFKSDVASRIAGAGQPVPALRHCFDSRGRDRALMVLADWCAYAVAQAVCRSNPWFVAPIRRACDVDFAPHSMPGGS